MNEFRELGFNVDKLHWDNDLITTLDTDDKPCLKDRI